MQQSPLDLLFYYVESLRWKVEEDFDPENAQPLVSDDIEWHLQRHDDEEGGPRKAAYRLRVSLPPREGRFPYSFEIALIGFFELHDTIAEDQVARVLDANAPAVLYGAAREALATSVGRGPFRPLILPSVNFLGIEREEAKPKKPARKLLNKSAGTAKAKGGKARATK